MSAADTTDFPVQPVVFTREGAVFTNSHDVAPSFEKLHKHVLRDIDDLIENGCGSNFGPTSKTVPMPNGGTRVERSFDMDRDGFMLLAMGFTGAKALKWKLRYIEAFNVMEAELRERPLKIEATSPRPGDLLSLAFADKMQLLDRTEEHFGTEGFRRVWEGVGFPSMAGLNVEPGRYLIPEPVSPFMWPGPDDDARACLRRMLDYRRYKSADRICDVIQRGLSGGFMYHPLKAFGIRITGPFDGDAPGIVVQPRSKGLQHVFGGTRWYDYAWIEPLSRLPGAVRRQEQARADSPKKLRDVVFLPAALLAPQPDRLN